MAPPNFPSLSLLFGAVALAAVSCGGILESGSSTTSCNCPDESRCVDEGPAGFVCAPPDGQNPPPGSGPGSASQPPGPASQPSGPPSQPPGFDGGAAVDAGPPPPEPPAGSYGGPCPDPAPAAGSSCTYGGYPTCVYGDNVDETCDQTFHCGGGDSRFVAPGTWWTDQSQTDACTSPGPADAKTVCPADFSLVNQGASCASPGLFCPYAQGLCGCTEGPGGAGATHPLQWVCAPPPTATPSSGNCPAIPPRTGMACSATDGECDYGSCLIGNAPVVTCSNYEGTSSYVWGKSDPTKKCY